MEPKSINDLLTSLTGQLVTVINTQSYYPTMTGYEVDVETYKAKVISFENQTVRLLMEYIRDPHKKIKEKAHQFIPVSQIKRITISKNERFLSL